MRKERVRAQVFKHKYFLAANALSLVSLFMLRYYVLRGSYSAWHVVNDLRIHARTTHKTFANKLSVVALLQFMRTMKGLWVWAALRYSKYKEKLAFDKIVLKHYLYSMEWLFKSATQSDNRRAWEKKLMKYQPRSVQLYPFLYIQLDRIPKTIGLPFSRLHTRYLFCSGSL